MRGRRSALASLTRFTGPTRLVIMLLGCAMAACGGGGGGEAASGNEPPAVSPSDAIGPIPAAEFATVPPPTFNQAVAAFRTVTAAAPALLGNEPALSRALFDEVRRSAGSAPPPAATSALFDLNARLTLEEWKLVIRSPLQSARAAATIEPSAQAARDLMPCEADIGFADGKADALRHAYWSALMTRRTGAAFAELFANAHEEGSSNTAAARAMDLHNNAAGRALALRYPGASEAELLELVSQQAFELVTGGAVISPTWAGLVYIAERAQRTFDGAFTGFLSDSSGATYALRLELAQCGATVRGRWIAARSGLITERRFSGALGAAATMTLVVANPLPFEAGAGPDACLSMLLELSASEKQLAGTWSSSGPTPACQQGGRITLGRP